MGWIMDTRTLIEAKDLSTLCIKPKASKMVPTLVIIRLKLKKGHSLGIFFHAQN